MKIKHYLIVGASTLSLLALSSCFDSDYDLSDIDTTSRFSTNNLVVPINLDTITLDQVLDIDDDSEVVKETDANGNTIYAIKKEGTFSSDPIKVATFTAARPTINPSSNQLDLTPLSVAAGVVDQVSAYYEIAEKSDPTHFRSTANNVDKSIKSIDKLGVATAFDLKIGISGTGVSAILPYVKYEGVKIQFPKGLTATASSGTYDPATGILDLSAESFTPNASGEVAVTLNITAIDASVANIAFSSANHTFAFEDDVQIVEGRVNIYDVDPATLPAQITFKSTPTLQEIAVNTFDGNIQYDVNDFDIEPVDLTDIPDLINQSGTKLMLENPQIYLAVTNPMSTYNVGFETGFQLTSVREGKSVTYGIDNGTFATAAPQSADNYFVLSPSDPGAGNYYDGYPNPKWVAFSKLKNILSGDETVDLNGIPSTIEVNAINPQIPEQPVSGFRLGQTIDAVEGDYSFYAPLQLSDNSRIVYTDTIDGWNDEDVDAITITKLILNFDGTTEIPFELDLTVYPINTDGKQIEGVTSTTAHVPAKAQDEPIEVTIEGNVSHLDGLLVKANIKNEGSETVLGPDMKIYIKNSKITITGYYEKEL